MELEPTGEYGVLPPAPSEAGGKPLERVEDLLTPEQQAALRAELEEMQRLRQQAEASADELFLW